MKKITVFGATGMIGKPVTQQLVNTGFEVTALVRDINKAKRLLPTGVNFIQGDINQIESIEAALKDAEGVYINLSTTPQDKEHLFNPETQGLDNILSVCKKSAGLKRIAYLSSFLARNYQGNWWVMKTKKSSITRVKNTGIAYTIFYPSNFMENFASGMARNGKLMVPKTSVANKAWWISGEDFGKQVAQSFKLDSAANREYPVQGTQSFTMLEAATEYASNYKKENLSVSAMPYSIMKIMGWIIPQMSFLSKLMGVMLNNKETMESDKTWNELGKPNVTIATFAQKQ